MARPLTSMTIDELASEMNRIDNERLNIRADGRRVKEELIRRNMLETVVSKLKSGTTLSESQAAFVSGLPVEEQRSLVALAGERAKDRAESVLKAIKGF